MHYTPACHLWVALGYKTAFSKRRCCMSRSLIGLDMIVFCFIDWVEASIHHNSLLEQSVNYTIMKHNTYIQFTIYTIHHKQMYKCINLHVSYGVKVYLFAGWPSQPHHLRSSLRPEASQDSRVQGLPGAGAAQQQGHGRSLYPAGVQAGVRWHREPPAAAGPQTQGCGWQQGGACSGDGSHCYQQKHCPRYFSTFPLKL